MDIENILEIQKNHRDTLNKLNEIFKYLRGNRDELFFLVCNMAGTKRLTRELFDLIDPENHEDLADLTEAVSGIIEHLDKVGNDE